jgi:hypothetical protein
MAQDFHGMSRRRIQTMSHLLVLAFIAIIAFGTQPSSLAFRRRR